MVGDRRTIRWFRPREPVDPARVQRILEAARMSACPGTLQPWRAVVIVQSDLGGDERRRPVDAANGWRRRERLRDGGRLIREEPVYRDAAVLLAAAGLLDAW